MSKEKIEKTIFIVLSIFVITACNSPITFITDSNNAATPGDNIVGNPTEPPFILGNPTVQVQAIDPNPIGLKDGLGSLDSYQMTFSLNSTDSNGNKTEVSEFTERSVIDRNTHSIIKTVSFDPENDDEESRETQETYAIGLETCSYDGEEWTYETVSDQEKEMADVFTNLVDFTPLIENPEFVGEEVINGVNSNHFVFKISGIGDTSGSIATINSGDYWLAKDGQYIVKYHLILQVRSGAEGTPDAEVVNIEALLDLTNINVPLNLTLPIECHP